MSPRYLLDTNVWLALVITPHVYHHAARTWLDQLTEARSIAFCRATQQSLLRLLSTAAVFAPYEIAALDNTEAWATYDELISDDRVRFHDEPHGLQESWRTMTSQNSASPKLWMDAYLAAFAVRSGMTLVSTDTAFYQFDALHFITIGE